MSDLLRNAPMSAQSKQTGGRYALPVRVTGSSRCLWVSRKEIIYEFVNKVVNDSSHLK
jgi:hypothetical protein